MIEATIRSKKKLASIGYTFHQRIHGYIKALLADAYDIKEVEGFLNNDLNIHLKSP